jgi:hypothetical protein
MHKRAPLLALALGAASRADVIALQPVADAFCAAAQPLNNFGAAGALAVASPDLPQGEFQSLLQFNTDSARAAFDSSFGPGQWRVTAVTLQLTLSFPMNPLFNAATAGPFGVSWMRRDDWAEGTGTPMIPTMDGVAFADLPGLIAGGEEAAGTLDFDGSTSGVRTWNLTATPGMNADIHSGDLLTLRLAAAGSPVACNCRAGNFPTQADRPMLAITAGIVEPACYANCDASTTAPVLNVLDFSCFLNHFAAGDTYANCDNSTTPPILNVLDFSCFLNRFAAGCS